MSDDTQSKLSQAFEHVEAGRLEDAISTLKPVLDASPDSADAWWIYLHAVNDPAEARHALDQVLRIAPDYPGAAEMLDLLNAEFPLDTPAVGQARPVEDRPQIKPITAPPPVSVPEAPVRVPESVSRTSPAPEVSAERRRSPVPTLIVLAVVAVAVVLVFLLLNPNAGQPDGSTATVAPTAIVVAGVTETALPALVDVATPTIAVPATTEETPTEAGAVAQETSEAVTDATSEVAAPTVIAVEATEVESAATTEPTDEVAVADQALTAFEAALQSYELAPTGVAIEELSTGSTVMANVCSAPGREVRTLLPEVMQTLARMMSDAPESAEAIGVRLTNCAETTVLVTVAAARADAAEYAAGAATAEQFAATWVALR
ncbi:MAG: tetratricopeptide repeat protein [Chloroflexi bacterium]|nr:tetratricopeptide repeat protein [Chloroflexota bacterium]